MLNASNPYAHYSAENSKCKGRLFEGAHEPLDDEDAEVYYDIDFDDAGEDAWIVFE